MCGYVQRALETAELERLLEKIGLEELTGDLFSHSPDQVEHFYPAFGGNPNRKIRNLIIQHEGKPRLVDATWWFDCTAVGDELRVGKRTSFNARNLDSPFWKGALRHHRGLVAATGIGESKVIDGKKHQFLMIGNEPFLLGALYRPFSNGHFSCAVITRDAHLKMEPYHDKAFPLFIPATKDFVQLWLDDTVMQSEVIDELLAHPKLTATLQVEEVKTFKRGSVSALATVLEADE
ncbi:SOS response-associated peptidase family protein [Allohahella marinimesophila]|uniref:SOS response-associated peptidase YedK n=1 Tax=Allohahella marinimesophila TaxID=1054972 RepID=A0ABP7NSC4_9GAMM